MLSFKLLLQNMEFMLCSSYKLMLVPAMFSPFCACFCMCYFVSVDLAMHFVLLYPSAAGKKKTVIGRSSVKMQHKITNIQSWIKVDGIKVSF